MPSRKRRSSWPPLANTIFATARRSTDPSAFRMASPQRRRSWAITSRSVSTSCPALSPSSTSAPRSRKQPATRLLPQATPPTRPKTFIGVNGLRRTECRIASFFTLGVVHSALELFAFRPILSCLQVDFQRHGQIRRTGHFLDYQLRQTVLLLRREFKHQLVVNLEQHLGFQSVLLEPPKDVDHRPLDDIRSAPL